VRGRKAELYIVCIGIETVRSKFRCAIHAHRGQDYKTSIMFHDAEKISGLRMEAWV